MFIENAWAQTSPATGGEFFKLSPLNYYICCFLFFTD